MEIFPWFHKSSKKVPEISEDTNTWPHSWKRPQYKIYAGAPIISLQEKKQFMLQVNDFSQVIFTRETHRNFLSDKTLSFYELSALLALSCGERNEYIQKTNKRRRTYSSAGALFPIEIYLFLNLPVDGILPGLYHYRPDIHALETLDVDDAAVVFFENTEEWMKKASVALVLSGVLPRTIDKYRDRGYRFLLLEAGGIGNNISLTATALGLAHAQVGGSDDRAIENLLDIDGVTESLLSVFLVGYADKE